MAYDYAAREGMHLNRRVGILHSKVAERDEFYPWCEERGIRLEPDLDKHGQKTGMMRIAYPDDNAKFEFKMRWL